MSWKKGIIPLSLAFVLVMCSLSSGCGSKVQATDLTKGVSAEKVETVNDLDAGSDAITDFAIRLLRENQNQFDDKTKKNILISPICILNALSMTANGANGDTLTQIEETIGMSVDDLNSYLYTYLNDLPQGIGSKLQMGNSIWFDETSGFIVNDEFLQVNTNYYDAELYQTSFHDGAVKDMNQWVDEKTDGMIPKIVDDIQDDTIMYLVSALAFDAKWEERYKSNDVWTGDFTLEDESVKQVKYMSSKETMYLKDDLGEGFIKYYKNRDYAFVAILPHERITISEYLASANGKQLHQLLVNAKETSVKASMPKFEIEYDMEMSQLLAGMGIQDAFDKNQADFSGIGTGTDGNIHIDRILHKTFMAVDQKGTKAGAAISLAAKTESAEYTEEYVQLNRPYIYMIVDCEYNLPIFIGTMMDVPN